MNRASHAVIPEASLRLLPGRCSSMSEQITVAATVFDWERDRSFSCKSFHWPAAKPHITDDRPIREGRIPRT
jgi:hypothetical protein